jgi:hypothetical protein
MAHMDVDADTNAHTSVAQPYIDCDAWVYTNTHHTTDVDTNIIAHPDARCYGDTNRQIHTWTFRHTNAHTSQYRNPNRYTDWFTHTDGYTNGYTITHTNSHNHTNSIINTNLDTPNYNDS